MVKPSLRLAATLALIVSSTGAAWAQSACQRYRAELAALGRGGGSQGYAAAAQRQRGEVARLSGYYHSIGCGGGGQSFFFGPPPECGAIAAQIRSMQARYSDLASRASSDGNDARRTELRAAVRTVCQREAEQRQTREERANTASVSDGADERQPRRARFSARSGGGFASGQRTVCVRACDGFHFPLAGEPRGRASANELCQALCPGAETAAYRMPGGDGEIGDAVSLKNGRPYTRLANAFKYQKSVDASCACKKEGETWAQLLQKAERMIARQPGDIIVTAQKAEELSRPKLSRTAARKKDAAKPEVASAAATKLDPKAAQELKQATEAASGATQTAAREGDGTVDVETTGSTKRKIRMVGPNVTPAPKPRP
jgi:hypothetical protein